MVPQKKAVIFGHFIIKNNNQSSSTSQYTSEVGKIRLGINIDGSINKAFKKLLMECAECKYPKTFNTKSYIIRRSQFIQIYIRGSQAAMIRCFSKRLEYADKCFQEYTRSCEDQNFLMEMIRLDREG